MIAEKLTTLTKKIFIKETMPREMSGVDVRIWEGFLIGTGVWGIIIAILAMLAFLTSCSSTPCVPECFVDRFGIIVCDEKCEWGKK